MNQKQASRAFQIWRESGLDFLWYGCCDGEPENRAFDVPSLGLSFETPEESIADSGVWSIAQCVVTQLSVGDTHKKALDGILSAAMSDAEELLCTRYHAEINKWDWDAIIAKCRTSEPYAECDSETPTQREYLGSVMSLWPSGKFYAPWCSNQTSMDVVRDSAFSDALDSVASDHDGWIENGEGDPTDVFFVMLAKESEDDDSDEETEDSEAHAESS